MSSIIHNGNLENRASFDESILESGLSIYEVIRIFNSKPLFLNDNLERLSNSLQKAEINYIQVSDLNIQQKIKTLIDCENIQNANFKFVLHFTGNNNVDEYLYEIPHSYPTEEDYNNGVLTITCRAERKNPEIKYLNPELRRMSDDLIKSKHVYEVILVNHDDLITEGSRSNLFFVKADVIYTAPLQYVLPGTGRKRVINICKNKNLHLIEECISIHDINNCDAAFITGTSPLVLPISQIDNIKLDANNRIVKEILKEYLKLGGFS